MDVQTHHQVVAFGPDRMMLFDGDAGTVVVEAIRNTDGNWVVNASGVPDKTVPPDAPNNNGANGSPTYRADAIQAMSDLAFESVGPNPNPIPGAGNGYSTLVPHGLFETP